MSKQPARLDPGLITLLNEASDTGVTIQSLVDAYGDRFGAEDKGSRSELRKWIYRRLVYMVRRKLLIKRDRAQGPSLYITTDSFQQMFAPGTGDVQEAQSDVGSGVRQRLSQYHVDMLACAGECKEYQRLVIEFPHLRPNIEQMHQAAKDRSAELVGQIRAINNILQRSPSS